MTVVDPRIAGAELAEDAPPEGLLEALVVGLDARPSPRPAILDVDVADELVVVVDGLGRIGPAVAEVAGVEAQAEQRRVDPVHDPGDLVGGLDVRPGVGMEDRLEALGPADLGGAMEVVDRGVWKRASDSHVSGWLAIRPEIARRIGLVEVIRQDRERGGARGRALGQDAQAVREPGPILVGPLGPAEMLRDERPDELEVSRLVRRSLTWPASPRKPGGPSSVPSKPMSTIQSSMSSGAGIQASSTEDLVDAERDRGAGDPQGGGWSLVVPPGCRCDSRLDDDLDGLARADPADPGDGVVERDRGRDHRREVQLAALDQPDRGREREVRDVRAQDREALLDDLDLVDRPGGRSGSCRR